MLRLYFGTAFLFLFSLITFPAFGQTNIRALLQQIPASDQKDLETFFQLLIKRGGMGYTLYGDKPISSAVFIGLEGATQDHITKYLILENGWRAWTRNQHLISDEHFVLIRKKGKMVSFFLMNKPLVRKKMEENPDLFTALGMDRFEEVVAQISSEEFRSHSLAHRIKGILYGYGATNAQYFACKTELLHALSSQMVPPFSAKKVGSQLPLNQKPLVELLVKKRRFGSQRAKSLQTCVDEFNQITGNEKSFELGREAPFLEQFCAPAFVTWDEEETAQLKTSYDITHTRLNSVYDSGSFLENTLQQWIAPQIL